MKEAFKKILIGLFITIVGGLIVILISNNFINVEDSKTEIFLNSTLKMSSLSNDSNLEMNNKVIFNNSQLEKEYFNELIQSSRIEKGKSFHGLGEQVFVHFVDKSFGYVSSHNAVLDFVVLKSNKFEGLKNFYVGDSFYFNSSYASFELLEYEKKYPIIVGNISIDYFIMVDEISYNAINISLYRRVGLILE